MEKYYNLLRTLGVELNQTQIKQFETYYNLLNSWNQRMNLTSITEKDDVYIKHFFDSLTLSKAVELNNQSLLDVGSGAGFPGIPLKIVYPDLKVTIIDSLNKRVEFINVLANELNIDVTAIHSRIEHHEKINHYDIVTARAVARLPMLVELCLPFAKVDGYFIAMKSTQADIELEESKKAIEILRGQFIENIRFEINNEERVIVKIIKSGLTPKGYPRSFNQIKNKPIL